ncbi:MAG: NUDIX hydrolase [Bacilli bacterium]|nr:NUDIX hydrolase [Bacilli bacterium]MDD4734259.1 NUDIX hydrolase [Bacilli bacterium]
MRKLKEKLYNNDNLKKEDITETVVRVKMLLVNSNNEVLLGFCHNTYQFPGGHQEEGETLIECVIREVKEETGIELTLREIEPFFVIRHYSKNYHGLGENRCSEIYYFEIKTDEKYDLSHAEYTENEKEGQFELKYINLEKVEEVLNESITWNEKNAVIVPEMITVFKEYKLINQ